MNLSTKTFSLYILVSITFLPYLASFLTLDVRQLFKVEIVAMICWYGTSLIIPLVINELSSSILFWFYQLVLVGIPIGSDIVHRITGITLSMWWYGTEYVMPVAWYMPDMLTRHYYSFIFNLGILLMPGCVFFVAMYWFFK